MAEAGHIDERLDLVRRIMREALASRPASSRAYLLSGALEFLSRLRAGQDAELLADRPLWSGRLERAAALAPARSTSVHFQCDAHLTVWRGLEEEVRRSLHPLMTRCFEDETTFRRIAPTWLDVSPSVDEALELVPPRSGAWQTLSRIFVRRRDWKTLARVEARRWDALSNELEDALDEARRRLAGGDGSGARAAYHAAVARLPPDRRFAPLLELALREAPAGSPPDHQVAHFGRLLDWALELDLAGHPALDRALLPRLLSWGRRPEPEHRAITLLLAGSRRDADLLVEQVEAPLRDERWAPFVVISAREAVARGDSATARRNLELLSDRWATLADELRSQLGDPVPEPQAWPRTAWLVRGRRSLLHLRTSAPSALEITWDEVPSQGALAAVSLDGARNLVVLEGARRTRLAGLTPGLHLIEIESAAGGSVVPGRVSRDDLPPLRDEATGPPDAG